MDDRFRNLKPQQRNCLRLVGKGLSSKEIAIELGLSPNTVDRYIHTAMATLGAANRRIAAKRLAVWEGAPQYKDFIYSSQAVAAVHGDMVGKGTQTQDPSRTFLVDPLAQARAAPPEAAATAPPVDEKSRPVLPLGGMTNDLTATRRIAAIFKLSLFSVISVTAIVMVAKGAFSLFG